MSPLREILEAHARAPVNYMKKYGEAVRGLCAALGAGVVAIQPMRADLDDEVERRVNAMPLPPTALAELRRRAIGAPPIKPPSPPPNETMTGNGG